MKIFKYSFMVLMIAVIANVALVNAYVNPNVYGYVYGTADMGPAETVRLRDDIQKDNIGAQSITNTRTFTTITDPCTDCKIQVNLLRKLSSGKYDNNGTIYFKQGETKSFISQDVSYSEGIYTLSFKRSGITAVRTYVGFDWKVQNSKV